MTARRGVLPTCCGASPFRCGSGIWGEQVCGQIRQKDCRRQGQADQAKRLPKAGANESCKKTSENGWKKSGGRAGGAAVMLHGQDNVDKKVKAL